MIKSYIKTAWRNILKRKGFSFINVGGLALGIASCLLLLLYVSYHLNFDKHFTNIDKVFICENNQPGDGKIYTFSATPRLLASSIKTEIPGVVETARAINYTAGGLITYNQNSFKKEGLFADAGFFSIFSYHFIEGNAAKALEQPNSIVITKDLAKTLFGNQDAMNKVISRNNKLPLTVTGVIENVPPTATFQFDFVMPWVIFENENAWAKNADWGSNFARTIVKLKDPSALPHINAMLAPIVGKHANGNKNQIFLFPFADLHLRGTFENGKAVGGMIDQMHLFEILALCILLIACVNFMNLSTARSEERAKEVGIRKAIGSGKRSLISQFLTESLMLSFLSTLIAVVILYFSIPFFNDLLNIKLKFPYDQPVTWIIIVGLAAITGLISGSYPAFYLSSFEPIKVLKGRFKGSSSVLPVRKVLVVFQFVIAVFLITATICIYRQIRFVQDKPNGYDKNNLVEIPVEGDLGKKYDVLVNELKGAGAITNATTLSQSITQNGSNTWGISWPGKQDNQKILFDIFYAGYDLAETTGIKLVEGREYSTQYAADTSNKSVMINETAAKLMNLKQATGTIIKWGDQPYTIIGVYKDFVWGSPYAKTPPMITPFMPGNNATVITARLNPNKTLTANVDQINKTLKSINPAYPPTVHFIDDEYRQKFENEKVLAMLANLFGGLAIVISCLGLFGLAAYAAEQRVKEIGVRKVLGATVGNLAALLSKDFLVLVSIAIVIAVPVSAWVMHNWLQKFENHIPLSWWIMALASIITIAIALLTVSYQAIKAALANPVKSLRSE